MQDLLLEYLILLLVSEHSVTNPRGTRYSIKGLIRVLREHFGKDCPFKSDEELTRVLNDMMENAVINVEHGLLTPGNMADLKGNPFHKFLMPRLTVLMLKTSPDKSDS